MMPSIYLSDEGLSDDVRLSARYAEPANRYPHRILGGVTGWSALHFDFAPCANFAAKRLTTVLPESRIFVRRTASALRA